MRVLVIGDLIIDDYVTCEPLGMSQEDPTIVVSPIDTTTFIGGAGVVSAHAKGLGAEVQFCSVVGEDEGAELARAKLEAKGSASSSLRISTRPTTRKQRFRAHNKTLLRVNHLRQHAASHEISSKMLEAIDSRDWRKRTSCCSPTSTTAACRSLWSTRSSSAPRIGKS